MEKKNNVINDAGKSDNLCGKNKIGALSHTQKLIPGGLNEMQYLHHALITWLITHVSRDSSCTDDVAVRH